MKTFYAGIRTRRAPVIALCGVLAAWCVPHVVCAQEQKTETADRDKRSLPFGFGVGLSVERRMPRDGNASDDWGVTLFPRFIGHGLGFAFNLPWTETSLVSRLGSSATELGVVRMKPSMVGVMWQQPVAPRTTAEIQYVAGYSFNSIAEPRAKSLRAQVAVPQAVTNVDGSFAWEVRLALWRELGPRVGVTVAGRYLYTRPQFTFADGATRPWKADRITLEAGLAFTLLKAPWARDRALRDTPIVEEFAR